MRPAPAHALLSALLLAGALSACSSDSPRSGATTDTATSQSEQVTTPTAAPAATDLTAVEGSDESDLGCGEPPQHLIDGLGTSSDTRPGPVIGAVVVFAATTDTGDWYVLGVDRLHEDEAGGTTPGDGSRSLALTNAVNPPVSMCTGSMAAWVRLARCTPRAMWLRAKANSESRHPRQATNSGARASSTPVTGHPLNRLK